MEAAISAAIAAAPAAAARLSFFVSLKWENRNAPGRHVIVRELFYWGGAGGHGVAKRLPLDYPYGSAIEESETPFSRSRRDACRFARRDPTGSLLAKVARILRRPAARCDHLGPC